MDLDTAPPGKKAWPTGPETVAIIREKTDTVFLSFSCGKDAVATWLALRDHFPRIIPYYCYLVPGLSFVERALTYYEDFFKTRIVRVPHPALYRMLRNGVFQTRERERLLHAAGLAKFDFEGLRDDLAEDYGLPKNHWVALGVRSSDTLPRLIMLRKSGPIIKSLGKFYPIWDMNKAQLVASVVSAGVKLAPEYPFIGRSFDGINFQYLWPVREHWPEDYARILEWFPMAELELRRHAYAEKHALRTQARVRPPADVRDQA